MNVMRDRAKEHFPMVLLTLLSIMQALALELLWSHVRETGYLFEPTLGAIVSGVQIAATFLGLVLIWVVYASTAMRFRWVPVTSDSVYPFLIGLIEFMLVESLGSGGTGKWLILMALTFGMMVLVSHKAMQRARQDDDNATFFDQFKPATLRDFVPHIAIVGGLALAGIYLLVSDDRGMVELLAVLMTAGILVWQFFAAARFWRQAVGE